MPSNMNNPDMSGDAPNTADNKIGIEIIDKGGPTERLRLVNHASDNQTEFAGHIGNVMVATGSAHLDDFWRQVEHSMQNGGAWVLVGLQGEPEKPCEEETIRLGYVPPGLEATDFGEGRTILGRVPQNETTTNVDSDQGKSMARTYSERDEDDDDNVMEDGKTDFHSNNHANQPPKKKTKGINGRQAPPLDSQSQASFQDATERATRKSYANREEQEVFTKYGKPLGVVTNGRIHLYDNNSERARDGLTD